jgi:hypothetical protein
LEPLNVAIDNLVLIVAAVSSPVLVPEVLDNTPACATVSAFCLALKVFQSAVLKIHLH